MFRKLWIMATVFNGQAAAGAPGVWDEIRRYNMEAR